MQVRISETYDLSTQVGKLGLVAIHTPDVGAIARRWGGLAQNHKFVKLVGCDVTMACASMLPADPLQIGLEAGDIAPQDMFNPILYTAVSNDSFNNIIDRIMYLTRNSATGSSIDSVNDPTFGVGANTEQGTITQADQFELYYALLSQNGGWKKSMPQSGLQMKGLYPIVYSLVNTIGNKTIGDASATLPEIEEVPSMDVSALGGPQMVARPLGVTLRGNPMRMPPIPTYSISSIANLPKIDADGTTLTSVGKPVDIPKCYVGIIVMPPAKLNRLYYRMRVTWTLEFIAPRPTDDIVDWKSLAEIGAYSYGSDYVQQSSTMSVTTSSVDATGATVDLVMEGS